MIAIFSRGQLGATFLDWSIRFLRGDRDYLAWPTLTRQALSLDPVQTNNAHQHQKLHPEGADRTLELIHQLQKETNVSFEFRELGFDLVGAAADIDITVFDHETIRKLKLAQQQDTTQALEYAQQNQCQIIRIEVHPAVQMFTCFDRGDGHEWLERRFPNSGVSRQQLWWQAFFTDQPVSNELWDLREHMALNLRPLDLPSLPPVSTWNFDHFYIDCLKWWFMGERVIHNLMPWLGIEINQQRFQSWLGIYQRWQKMLEPNINFVLEVDSIVKAIVQGEYRQLPHLTLFQEAIIQHFLIYRYNLNLRNWQLSYFPDNTRDLHLLLEPNIHPVIPY